VIRPSESLHAKQRKARGIANFEFQVPKKPGPLWLGGQSLTKS